MDSPPWPNVTTRWLAHSDMGATLGSQLEVTVPPGAAYEPHRHADVERVVYVLRGAGTHIGSDGPLELATDDVLVVPPGGWHGFVNQGEDAAMLWVIYAPAATFPADDYEAANGDGDFGGSVTRSKLREVPDDPDITRPENGFINMQVIWDGAQGASAITLGIAWFDPGSRHMWHRHPHGDEVIYVSAGTSHHVTDTGDMILEAPAYAFSPANEWHTMPVEEKVECYFTYLGGASLEEVGYERRLS